MEYQRRGVSPVLQQSLSVSRNKYAGARSYGFDSY